MRIRRILIGLVVICLLLPALAAAQDFPPQVQKALDDLNARLGLQLTLRDFNWRYSQNVYPDNSLGCPQPGVAYFQGNTIGYQVELDVQGLTWDYRVSPDLSRVTLCSPLATPTPTPRPTYPPPVYQPNVANPNSTATPAFCPNAPAPRLVIGQQARVQPGTPNIVRQAPGTSSGYLGEMPAGEVIYVLDGPRCASGMAWWYVAGTYTKLAGWTSEGQSGSYWLELIYLPNYATPLPTLPGLVYPTNPPPIGYAPTITPVGGSFFVAPTLAPAYPTPTPSPTITASFPTTTGIVCDPTVPPRLMLGANGRVTPGIPNNIRAGAGTSTAYVGEIPPGGVFRVMDGPRCASGMAWWRVSYGGLNGWTPEGQGGDYWVEPVY